MSKSVTQDGLWCIIEVILTLVYEQLTKSVTTSEGKYSPINKKVEIGKGETAYD